MSESLNACGYIFKTAKDATKALDEEKRIRYIKSRLDFTEPESVLIIYNKMLANKIFETPVGYVFLDEIRQYLLNSKEVDDSSISDIICNSSFTADTVYDVKIPVKKKAKKGEIEALNSTVKGLRLTVAALVVMIIAMFVISMNSENPNILNYKTNLENKYASWDQELNERERTVKEKEYELGLR